MRKTKSWSIIVIALVICVAIASRIPVFKQMMDIKFGNTSKAYIGWVLLEGMHGSNQWHITSEKISLVGSQWAMLNPGAMGPGIIFSDYYPPGTRLFKIPGINPVDALAIKQPDGIYVLAVHASHPPSKNLDTCEGWVELKAKHLPGHYKVLSQGITNVGHVIGAIGANFTSEAFPIHSPVYAISGTDPKTAIAIGNRGPYHDKAIWVSEPSLS